jgi:membrane-associated protein
MTATLLVLLPLYGPWLILGSVLLSCLALPVPSSMLVMVAGGFAASGDLVLWQVALAAFAGFVLGDQAAFQMARAGGPPLLARLRARGRIGPVIDKAEGLLDRHGLRAVLISRTVASPLGPYVGYLSGALGLRWAGFTATAMLGAAIWSGAYAGLGYGFADRISDIGGLMTNVFGVIVAVALLVTTGWWMRRSWRAAKARQAIA